MTGALADGAEELVVTVAAERTAPREARQALHRLEEVLEADTFRNVELLVSELVTNSVRHGASGEGAQVTLRVLIDRETVRIEVVDPGEGFVPPVSPTPRDDEGGYGLFLVDQLARRWGVERLAKGTRVWFDLDRP